MIAIAQMGSLMVIAVQHLVEIGLQHLHGFIELLSQLEQKDFFLHSPMESLDENTGLGMAQLRGAIWNAVQGEIEFKMI